MLVLIEEEELKEVNAYLEKYDINVVNGRVVGKLADFNEEYTPNGTSTIESTYYPLVEAVYYSDVVDDNIAIYVGNLSEEAIEDLLYNNFYIDKYDTVIIGDSTDEVYECISDMRNECGPLIKPVLDLILSQWPVIYVTERATTIMDIGSTIRTHKLNYHPYASRFHTELAIPFDNIGNGYFTGNVLVTIKHNDLHHPYHYTVFIADNPGIDTDTLPTPDTLIDLILESHTIWYKIKKYIRGLL